MAIEIERKYIIRKPSINVLSELDGYSVSEIIQTYIDAEQGITHRVRKRTCGESVKYTETKKIRIDKMSAHEFERELSESEYNSLAKNIKRGTKPINKARHTFIYKGQLFEIDVYPEWTNSCILETELESREVSVEFPDFIEIIEEVTGNHEYSNASMAKRFPKEKKSDL